MAARVDQAEVVEQGRQQGAGKHIACPVVITGYFLGEDVVYRVGRPVVGGGPQFVFLEINAGQYHFLRTQCAELPQQAFDICVGVRPRMVRFVEQQGRLGEVGHDDVGFLAKHPHAGCELASEDGVQFAVVAHNRVNQYQVVFLPECVEKLLNDVELFERTEEAGVDGIELYVELTSSVS